MNTIETTARTVTGRGRLMGRRLAGAGFTIAISAGVSVGLAGVAHADPNPNITICHATGNSGKWVVQTIDAAAITGQGHDQHQGQRDVIPPFTYVADNTDETVTYEGLNWSANWAVTEAGVAQVRVTKEMCAGGPTSPPPSSTPTPTKTHTATPTATGTSTPPATSSPSPTKPIVETDGGSPSGTNFVLVGAGSALVLAGGASLVLLNRRRGTHS